MGAEAIKELLKQVDLKKEIEKVHEELENTTGQKEFVLLKDLIV